ncbi:MAG: biotin/lipoyl-containing protein [Bacteroidales bacterium]|nr:biotin/lipoyl-containing protein [Bacteroidales bacterium]
MKISEKRALVLKRQKAKDKELAKMKKEQEREAKKLKKTAEREKKLIEKEIADKQKYDVIQVFPNARMYKTTLTKKYINRKVWKRPDPQEVKSIIPGVVTSLEIKEGDHVVKGSHIMTFEAMKMQNLVLAPFDGTIEKIFVKEGEKVPKGGIMLFLKSDKEFEIIMDRATSTDLGLIE